MDAKIKQFITQCIEQCRGDNLYRASHTFKNLTKVEMNEEYGESGQTPQQIIEGYTNHCNKCDEAIKAMSKISSI